MINSEWISEQKKGLINFLKNYILTRKVGNNILKIEHKKDARKRAS